MQKAAQNFGEIINSVKSVKAAQNFGEIINSVKQKSHHSKLV